VFIDLWKAEHPAQIGKGKTPQHEIPLEASFGKFQYHIESADADLDIESATFQSYRSKNDARV